MPKLKKDTTHLVVRAKRDRFRRGGVPFTREPRAVVVEVVGREAAAAICDESAMLHVEQHTAESYAQWAEMQRELAPAADPAKPEVVAADYIEVELRGELVQVDVPMVRSLIGNNEQLARENSDLHSQVDALTKELQDAKVALDALRKPPSEKARETKAKADAEKKASSKGKGGKG